jgi:hypothetical protein
MNIITGSFEDTIERTIRNHQIIPFKDSISLLRNVSNVSLN